MGSFLTDVLLFILFVRLKVQFELKLINFLSYYSVGHTL